MNTYTHTLKGGFGFDVGQDFARAVADTPARLAPSEYAKPGRVIAYIPANPTSSLGFLKYGDRNREIRIHALSSAFVAGVPRMSPAEFQAFKVKHETALSDLRTYALDAQEDADRLNPILQAKGIDAMIEAAPNLHRYLACSVFIDEFHQALMALSAQSHASA